MIAAVNGVAAAGEEDRMRHGRVVPFLGEMFLLHAERAVGAGGVSKPAAPVETCHWYFRSPSTMTVIFWLILAMVISTLAAAAGAAPAAGLPKMIGGEQFQTHVQSSLPSGLRVI